MLSTARRRSHLIAAATLLAVVACASDSSSDAATSTPVTAESTTRAAPTSAPGTTSTTPSTTTTTTTPATTSTTTTTSTTSTTTSTSTTSTSTSLPPPPEPNTEEVAIAVDAFLALLTDEQRAVASQPYGPQLAMTWSYLPACGPDNRVGVRHAELTPDQYDAWLHVVDAALSDEGYAEFVEVVAAEDIIGATSPEAAQVWASGCYRVAVFGTPSVTEPWALQFTGHHLARTITFAGDDVTATPSFVGIAPGEFVTETGPAAPLAEEAAAIFGIFASLDADQLGRAEIVPEGGVFADVVAGPGVDVFPPQAGLPVTELPAAAQALVLDAIAAWAADVDPSVAAAPMESYAAELEQTTVGWSTSVDPTVVGSYGRIDGPRVWIEFVVQNDHPAIAGAHFHTIYRDKSLDYGPAA